MLKPTSSVLRLALSTLLAAPLAFGMAAPVHAADPAAAKPAGAAAAPKAAAPKAAAPKATKASKKSGKTAPAAEAAPASTEDAPVTDPPAGSSPLEELKKSHASLKKLMDKQPPDWSPEKDAKTSEVRKTVGQFLDAQELAKRALAKHWDGLTPAQRTDFVATLRELVDRSYLKQIHGQADYNLTFDKEERAADKGGREANVFATLNTVVRGKKTKMQLEFRLVHKSRWVVYDIVTDEQSLLETYRAEFNKIIAKESFDALLKRMKKKLESGSEAK